MCATPRSHVHSLVLTRRCHVQEITNDFGSNDSERIEYLKSITMVSMSLRPSVLSANAILCTQEQHVNSYVAAFKRARMPLCP